MTKMNRKLVQYAHKLLDSILEEITDPDAKDYLIVVLLHIEFVLREDETVEDPPRAENGIDWWNLVKYIAEEVKRTKEDEPEQKENPA